MNASDSEKEDAEIEATETAPDEENAKLKERLALMIKCVFFFCWEEPDVHMPRSI